MIYFYNESNRILYDRTIQLSKAESKLLNLLINNKMLDFKTLEHNGFNSAYARVVKNRLMEKTFLNILTINGIGYRLDDQIYIFKENKKL